jgi:hypothetical protein
VLNEGGLQKIDDDAFSGCTSLERIAIPSVVQWREDDEMFSSYAYKCVIGDIFSEIIRQKVRLQTAMTFVLKSLRTKEVKDSILEYLKY